MASRQSPFNPDPTPCFCLWSLKKVWLGVTTISLNVCCLVILKAIPRKFRGDEALSTGRCWIAVNTPLCLFLIGSDTMTDLDCAEYQVYAQLSGGKHGLGLWELCPVAWQFGTSASSAGWRGEDWTGRGLDSPGKGRK